MDTLSNSDFYSLLAVILFGASGMYLLLPHGQGLAKPRIAHWVGLGLSAIAVLAIARFWKVENVELVSKVLFYGFGLASIACAILTITSRDPVHSALWFAAVVLATSGLFLMAGAQFLAAGTVIVYAGAIIVTFLFVIMLAQKEGRAIYDRMARAPFLATLASFLLLLGLILPLLSLKPFVPDEGMRPSSGQMDPNRLISTSERLIENKDLSPKHKIVLERSMSTRSRLPVDQPPGGSQPAHVASLGTALFTDHLLTVELVGALLFAALIGALAIASPRPPIRPTTATSTPTAEVA